MFYQHLQPALIAVPAVLLFLLCSIALGFSASAYVLLYTAAHCNTHEKAPSAVISPRGQDRSSGSASSSTGRTQLSGPPLLSRSEGNMPPESNSFQGWEGGISLPKSIWWITYLQGAGGNTLSLMFIRVRAAPHCPKPLPHPQQPPLSRICLLLVGLCN